LLVLQDSPEINFSGVFLFITKLIIDNNVVGLNYLVF